MDGFTPLHAAVLGGQAEAVKALVRLGADIRTRAKAKCTALHIAASKGHTELVGLLVELGVGVHAQTQNMSASWRGCRGA